MAKQAAAARGDPGRLRYHCLSPLQDIHRILALATEHPQTLSQSLPPGTLLKEYSVLSVLGMGGFGITYLAADNYLHLKVAIKEYFPSSAVVRNPFSGAVALKSEKAETEYSWGKDRFMREAQTLARFSHKNIVQVFRYFEGNGTCYMVMAYEEGQSLEAALEENPTRWDTQAVLDLLLPLLDGLESVHAAGFLHRDIKPANIVLRAKDSSPVLIDFGAARAPTATDALTIVLSHGYGPPEQYSRQGHQGPWTDIYALAGVLYRIVSGSVPPVSLHRMRDDPIIPATFSGEGRFGEAFLKAIDLALSVDETRRPQSIGEWRKLLVEGTAHCNTLAAVPTGTIVRHAAPAAGTGRSTPAPLRAESAAKAAPAVGHSPGAIPTAPTSRTRTSRRLEEESEAGPVGRIGQMMIAHPFLSLLLLAVALFAVLNQLRQPDAAPAPKAVASEPATRALPVELPQAAAPPVAGPEVREQIPASAPPSAPTPDDSGEQAATQAANTGGERLRELRRAALAACADKSRGDSCRVVTPRDEVIDATCMTSAEGQLICKPARLGQRPADLSGIPSVPGVPAEAWRQPQIPRIPR